MQLYKSGELGKRSKRALSILSSCSLCPRRCAINRLEDERGECRIGRYAVVSSFAPHFGEEGPLVGRRGSGTIFFSGCNLHCVFCQNSEISQSALGEVVDAARLASIMLALQDYGCHNVNFVSPTHVVPQILEALPIAIEKGLRLPIVYNSGGYESLEVLRLLDRVVDIYMPDAKYGDDEAGEKYSAVSQYWNWNRKVLKEMHRQVGILQTDSSGVALKGLLIRHLVLPNGLAKSETVLRFIAEGLSPDSYVNIMDQYRPCYHAGSYPELRRRLTVAEYEGAVRIARSLGLHRGF